MYIDKADIRFLVYEDDKLMEPIIPLSEVKPNRYYRFSMFMYHVESETYGTVPYDGDFRII